MTIEGDLTKSIAEERKAASAYRARARIAAKLGYAGVAKLYLHIAHEEDAHADAYRGMRAAVRKSKRRK